MPHGIAEEVHSRAKKKMMKSSKHSSMLERIGHEIKENPPGILAHTKEKFGPKRAESQRKAILLSKFRRGDY